MNRSRGRILIPIVVLVFSLACVSVARVYAAANQLLRDVNTLQVLLGENTERTFQLEPLVAQTAADYRDLRGLLGPTIYVTPFFGWLPIYGGDLANLPALFDLGDSVAAGASSAAPILNSLSSQNGGQAPGVEFLNIVNANKTALEQLRWDFSQANRARARLDVSRLSPAPRRWLEHVDQFLAAWQIALDAAEVAPNQLGEDRPRVYLLLAQNSDELRATGGFISSVALVRVQRGEFTVTDFQDSYAVDDLRRFHPEPPVALTKYMFAGLLLLRDANWYPDFPTSARVAQNLYRVDRGISTDGVIAVNFKGIPRLLEAMDGVTVEPGSERVDAANVMTKVRTYWAPPQSKGPTPEWWRRRKDFLGQLLAAVMQKIKQGEYSRVKLAQAIGESIAAKDLLVYLKDVDESKQAHYLWSGALAQDSEDTLMIVDSNVGFNKVDGTIERRAEYEATVAADGSVHAMLTITYANLSAPDGKPCVHQPFYPPSYADLQQGCYWNYLRVIAPAASQLLRAEGVEEPVTEPPLNGRAVFGGYFVLPRGETRVVRWEYREPANPQRASHYGLTLEKEPGAPDLPVHVRIVRPWNNVADFSITLDRNQKLSFDDASPFTVFGTLLVSGLGATLLIVGARRWRRKD